LKIEPMTELDAINLMLAAIGEAPVNSIGTGLSESRLAQIELENTSRFVQSIGWYFNTEDNYPLSPNNKGSIQVPRNTLKVDPQNRRYVARNNLLYDKVKRTTVFEDTVLVTLVFGHGWDDLPETAKNYITIRAARRFQDNNVGSNTLHAFHANDEAEAELMLKTEELESGNYNLFANPQLQSMQSRSPSKTYNRGTITEGFLT